jgi:hypothetical protein
MVEFYMHEFIVADHPQGIILARIIGHEIYENDIVGYKVQLPDEKIVDETLFNGNDEENGEIPIRKATEDEIKIFTDLHQEYQSLKMKTYDLIDELEDKIKF